MAETTTEVKNYTLGYYKGDVFIKLEDFEGTQLEMHEYVTKSLGSRFTKAQIVARVK